MTVPDPERRRATKLPAPEWAEHRITWLNLSPGQEDDVLVYRPITDSPTEALEAAERMVAVHEVDWVHLRALERQRVGKGADGFRWMILARVRGRGPVAVTDRQEEML